MTVDQAIAVSHLVANNCGTGGGGFKPGNKCGGKKSGGGGLGPSGGVKTFTPSEVERGDVAKWLGSKEGKKAKAEKDKQLKEIDQTISESRKLGNTGEVNDLQKKRAEIAKQPPSKFI